jgi:hypothetical protein
MARMDMPPGPGRPKGLPNKATLEFKEAVTNLLNHAAPEMTKWLETIAADNPEKAFDIIAKLGEYAFPKLARTEIRNADGETFKTEHSVAESDKDIINRYLQGTKNA